MKYLGNLLPLVTLLVIFFFFKVTATLKKEKSLCETVIRTLFSGFTPCKERLPFVWKLFLEGSQTSFA